MARYVFVGPSILEWRPFQPWSPSRLSFATPLGLTVWRDSTGAWQQKLGPTLSDLSGATVVYGGGRQWPLTDQQRTDLIAAGYGSNIITVPDAVPNPPWPTPTYAYPAAVVDTARVGYAATG